MKSEMVLKVTVERHSIHHHYDLVINYIDGKGPEHDVVLFSDTVVASTIHRDTDLDQWALACLLGAAGAAERHLMDRILRGDEELTINSFEQKIS
jgi:hypothetical protein